MAGAIIKDRRGCRRSTSVRPYSWANYPFCPPSFASNECVVTGSWSESRQARITLPGVDCVPGHLATRSVSRLVLYSVDVKVVMEAVQLVE
jgi:hypothetical protein